MAILTLSDILDTISDIGGHMSDGPYRSLPMRPSWKKVAEWVENENFDVHQVAARIAQAVSVDFRRDVPSDAVTLIKSAFDATEGQLFPDQQSLDLSNARRLLDGSPWALSLTVPPTPRRRKDGVRWSHGCLKRDR